VVLPSIAAIKPLALYLSMYAYEDLALHRRATWTFASRDLGRSGPRNVAAPPKTAVSMAMYSLLLHALFVFFMYFIFFQSAPFNVIPLQNTDYARLKPLESRLRSTGATHTAGSEQSGCTTVSSYPEDSRRAVARAMQCPRRSMSSRSSSI
jgi:hypothetical protein